MKNNYTDVEIITAIEMGGQTMEQMMHYIYKSDSFKSTVYSFVKINNGNQQDAEDIFQDGLVHLVLNIQKGSFRGESRVHTYFMSICKNLWYNALRRTSKLNNIKNAIVKDEKTEHSPEVILMFKERSESVRIWLEKLGSPCREILSLWGLHYSMLEIAKKTGYKNEGVMRKKKHQCMQKLMTIAEHAKGFSQA